MKQIQMLDSHCQSCGSLLMEVLDLGEQPICNRLLDSPDEKESLYPLNLTYCRRCSLVQLEKVPRNDIVFGRSFNYLTGATPEAVAYFESLAAKMMRQLNLQKGDWVVDIGSNDGTFLKPFREAGINVLGVDPSFEAVSAASRKGVQTIRGRFESNIEEVLSVTRYSVKLVTAFNVLAHTDDIHGMLEGIKRLTRTANPFVVTQSHYLPRMLEGMEWDTIYHEHARYYSFSSLNYLMSLHRLYPFSVEFTDYYGGSFLTYGSGTQYEPEGSMVKAEKGEFRLRDDRTFIDFAANVKKEREWLQNLLMEIKAAGKSIAGIGAPMKSSTLLNYCGIGSRWIDYLTEVNPLKLGKYAPGSHIPIVHEDTLFSEPTDYALILSWNLKARIMKDLRKRGYRGKFIVPMPRAMVLD